MEKLYKDCYRMTADVSGPSIQTEIRVHTKLTFNCSLVGSPNFFLKVI